MQVCNKCKIEKKDTEYHTTGKNRTLKKTCKLCINTARRAKHKANPEHARTLDKARYTKDKVKRKIQGDAYREANKEQIKQRKREYAQSNKELIAAKQKSYYENNKSKLRYKAKIYYDSLSKSTVRSRAAKYRATESGKITTKNSKHNYRANKLEANDNTITHEYLQNLLLRQDNRCYHCNELLLIDDVKHLDHYIPLSKGGKHSIGNVVWSCATCNMVKGNTIPSVPLTFKITTKETYND